jgi:hypothetical protein
LASAPLRASWLAGHSARVLGASTGATRGNSCGRARLTAVGSSRTGPQRIADHRGAREVVEPARCARVPFRLQKSSSSVWLREATPVAAGVGDGGLAIARRLAPANSADGLRCRQRRQGSTTRGGSLVGGRRSGSWQPSFFTERRGKRSWLFGSRRHQASHPGATGASEFGSARLLGCGIGNLGGCPNWTKRFASA